MTTARIPTPLLLPPSGRARARWIRSCALRALATLDLSGDGIAAQAGPRKIVRLDWPEELLGAVDADARARGLTRTDWLCLALARWGRECL